MKIILTAIDKPLRYAWQKYCSDLPGVTVYRGSILDKEVQDSVDFIVSPANSFGFMDGGIDEKYLDFYGVELESHVRDCILTQAVGELPVGNVLWVKLPQGYGPKALAVAPTMRVPMRLPNDTIAPYLAARAVLRRMNETTTIAFPGLGTGVGEVPPERCAFQFRQAYLSLARVLDPPAGWLTAERQHNELVEGPPRKGQP